MPTNVLILVDDPAISDLLAGVVRSKGFDVQTTDNEEEGIRLLREKSPQMVILDLRMQNRDGWQACRNIRRVSNAPILILSAIDDPGTIASALDAGADDYLTKPVHSNILIAHLNKFTRQIKKTPEKVEPPQPYQPVSAGS